MPIHKRLLVYIAFILITIWVTIADCSAASDWEFHFFGINTADFKDRSVPVIIAGAVSSFLVHEAGHFAIAMSMGDGAHYDPHRGGALGAVIVHGYNEMSHFEQQMFHGGGFLFQAIVGSILTVTPYTRHSDFALGFNGFTMVNTAGYTFKTDVEKHPTSDVAQLDHGVPIALGTTMYAAFLAYYNLDKVK